jgi:hypothetical protein
MSDRDTVRQALYDAIDWQNSFAESNHPGSPERAEARAQVKLYRALLKRRYGTSQTPMEARMEGATYVTLDELRSLHEKKDKAP